MMTEASSAQKHNVVWDGAWKPMLVKFTSPMRQCHLHSHKPTLYGALPCASLTSVLFILDSITRWMGEIVMAFGC